MAASSGMIAARAVRALRHPGNWVQLAKFSVVGFSGYLVNLVAYTLLLRGAGLHYLAAGACSFVVAAANNYYWNRHWTFRKQRGDVYGQGIRFLIVSLVALGANLGILHVLITAGWEDRCAGDRGRPRDAAELHRQQALVLQALS